MKFGPNLLSFSIGEKHLSLKNLLDRVLSRKVLQNIKTLFIINMGSSFNKIKLLELQLKTNIPLFVLVITRSSYDILSPIVTADSIASKVDIVYVNHNNYVTRA